jgi:hypothetical protein
MNKDKEGEECEHMIRIDNLQCIKCKKFLKMDFPPY